MSENLKKISEFLETIEANTEDKQTADQIREFMAKEDLWIFNKPVEETPPVLIKTIPRQIVYNAVTCLACHKTLESRSRHDFKSCGCPNRAMVDGGHAYTRYGAEDMSKLLKHTCYLTDPHEELREAVTWGTYGKEGKDPLRHVKIKDMSDAHVQAVIVYPNVAPWIVEILQNEQVYRSTHNISITD
jgi:hypothetical protein